MYGDDVDGEEERPTTTQLDSHAVSHIHTRRTGKDDDDIVDLESSESRQAISLLHLTSPTFTVNLPTKHLYASDISKQFFTLEPPKELLLIRCEVSTG